jgi:hopene-associated glycosyltransferase HpnB
VAIVIPARNEAALVGQAVDSLVRQDYAGRFHIFVVDDQSSDETAARARAAAGPGRLTVISVPPRAEGWTGKLWAVSAGIRAAAPDEPEYFLLTDADITHAPASLSRLVAQAAGGGYDIVSRMAELHCETFAERALIPPFVFFFFLLYPPAWIADPRRATAGAAGGCLLIRRAALDAIGGMAAIRSEIIDDCALARAVKRRGGTLRLELTRQARSIREYGGFTGIGRMISRSAFTQLRHSPWLLTGALAGMFATFLLPPLLVGRPLGTLACLLMMTAYTPMLRYYRRSVLWAPFLPLAAAFYIGATVHSAIAYWRGRGGVWKGRVQDPL